MKNLFLKIKTLFKNYWLFISLSLVTVLLIGNFVIFRKIPSEKEEIVLPPPVPPSWQEIEPGKTMEVEIRTKLGKPLKEYQEEEGKTIEYPSDYEFYPNKIYIEESVVILIKEQITHERNLNLRDYLEKYGDPSLVMYDSNWGNARPLNIFLDFGFAVAAHAVTGRIIEIWHFEPVTQSEFTQTVGKNLSPTPFRKF